MLFRPRYLRQFGGHDLIQFQIMREVVNKGQNCVAVEQQTFGNRNDL